MNENSLYSNLIRSKVPSPHVLAGRFIQRQAKTDAGASQSQICITLYYILHTTTYNSYPLGYWEKELNKLYMVTRIRLVTLNVSDLFNQH